MNYTTLATSETPALIVYLLDISASMDKRLGGKDRLSTALEALESSLRTMVFRSTKGAAIAPRYRIAVYLYSDDVYDLLGGVLTVDKAVGMDLSRRRMDTGRGTDTARAFAAAAELISHELPHMQGHPAPLICHLTDDRYTGKNPGPIVESVKRMRNRDGSVLVQNIFISNRLGKISGKDAYKWHGITRETAIKDRYGEELKAMSSPIPESYHRVMREFGSAILPEAVMLFPGNTPEFIRFGFQMSGSTMTG